VHSLDSSKLSAYKKKVRDASVAKVNDVDKSDLKDPQTCAEYASEIFEFLKSQEH
jgi:hypothetical protein